MTFRKCYIRDKQQSILIFSQNIIINFVHISSNRSRYSAFLKNNSIRTFSVRSSSSWSTEREKAQSIKGIGKRASRSTSEWQIDFVRLLPFSTPSIRVRGMRSISSRVINNIQRLVFPSRVARRKEKLEAGGCQEEMGDLFISVSRERTNHPVLQGQGHRWKYPIYMQIPYLSQRGGTSLRRVRPSTKEPNERFRVSERLFLSMHRQPQASARGLNEYYLGPLLIEKIVDEVFMMDVDNHCTF